MKEFTRLAKAAEASLFISLHTSGAKSVTVVVRTFVGALIGPTDLVDASGFFWMNTVWFASPLYVPSGICDFFGVARVVAGRLFADSASFDSSSNQLFCFAASFVLVIGTLRSAVKFVAESSWSEYLFADEAVTTPVFFFLRLMLWPDSFSEEQSEESSLCDGAGVAGLFLMFPLAIAPLFLNVTTKGSIPVGAATFPFVSAIFEGKLSPGEMFKSF